MTPNLDPRSRRALVVVPIALAMLSMIGPFSIDTPFPAFGQMREAFDVTSSQMQWVVTSYMLAFAVMSVLHGPLSDAVGRRPVIVGGLVVYTLASIGAALSPDYAVLLGFRVLQGLSAGGATIVSRTIVRDLYEGPQAQVLMSRVMMIFGIAPAIAPVIGGLVLQVGPWPLVFTAMALLGVVLVALTLLVLPESHPPERRTPLAVGEILRGLASVLALPDFHRAAWAMTFAFAGQFLYIGGAAIFVVDLLGRGELDFWMFFVPIIGGMVVGSWISGRAAGRTSARRLVSAGFTVGLVGALLGVVLAATPYETTMPWVMVGPCLLAMGNGILYPTINLMLLDMFPARRGAVVSASAFISLVVNAVCAVALTPVVGGSVLGFAVTALALFALGLLLWSWQAAVWLRDAGVSRAGGDVEPVDQL